MEEIAAGGGMSLWINVALAIVTALGGLELLKYLISLRAHRRKDSAQAKQEENTAAQQDVEIRQKEYELMRSFIDQYKERNEELQSEIRDYKADKAEDRKLKEAMRKELSEFKIAQVDQERRIAGLQRAFTESESRRKAAERFYCSDETCPNRRPPLGTYDSAAKVA